MTFGSFLMTLVISWVIYFAASAARRIRLKNIIRVAEATGRRYIGKTYDDGLDRLNRYAWLAYTATVLFMDAHPSLHGVFPSFAMALPVWYLGYKGMEAYWNHTSIFGNETGKRFTGATVPIASAPVVSVSHGSSEIADATADPSMIDTEPIGARRAK